jgi:DNA-binding protein H-NS
MAHPEVNIKRMNEVDLRKLEKMVQSELGQRKHLSAAGAEITRILEKYKLNFDTVAEFLKLSSNTPKPTSAKQPKLDKRKKVVPRYKSPDEKSKWSGRGKQPAWVKDVCERENISLEQFKRDSRYQC